MCCCHKVLFALKQLLRLYLKEETQEYVWNVHQWWDCLFQPPLSLLKVRPRCAWVFFFQLLLHPYLPTEGN